MHFLIKLKISNLKKWYKCILLISYFVDLKKRSQTTRTKKTKKRFTCKTCSYQAAVADDVLTERLDRLKRPRLTTDPGRCSPRTRSTASGSGFSLSLSLSLSIYLSISIYIYIYIHTHAHTEHWHRSSWWAPSSSATGPRSPLLLLYWIMVCYNIIYTIL